MVTAIQPQLWVDRGRAAVSFYEAALGARVLHLVGEGEDIFAQLAVDGAAFWVAAPGQSPKRFVPRVIEGATARLVLVVDDPDALFARAVEAGAEAKSAIDDEHGWR